MPPYRIWRAQHAEALKTVPLDEIRIDTSWSIEGFATIQVWISERFAKRFAKPS
jgi:hypothetical protein